ncbi:retropepsin-like aspartic protease [Archangium violaceum]|uniref:retropepsin-like aspartic protease n=1 Tax=Archangium violaceum TaxID=83451 RepID=UPI002B2FFA0B|nr:retropepsin-like aspartic protease [Archangium gephyra]
MNRLHLALQTDFLLQEHEVKAPKVLVRIGYNGRWSRAIRAVVDTGSPLTIISPDVAHKLGWVEPPEEQPVAIQGIGSGQESSGWMTAMDIAFLQSPAQEPTLGLLLRTTAVCVSTLVGQGAVLVGQHESLERLRFTQRNQPPYWDFELALPEEEET